jgi:hypothetical protein
VAALVTLAGCLPSYAQLCSNLGPADPKGDGRVNERLDLRLRLIPRHSDRLDPFENLTGRPTGRVLGTARTFGCRFVPPSRLCSPVFPHRPARGPSHTSSMRLIPHLSVHWFVGSASPVVRQPRGDLIVGFPG